MGRFAKTEQYSAQENAFWDRLCQCAGQPFLTLRGLAFTFEVRGNEVFFDRKEKSITRATIIRGYRKALELQAASVPLHTPKQLEIFGASYLCPILQSLGILGPLTPLPRTRRKAQATDEERQ